MKYDTGRLPVSFALYNKIAKERAEELIGMGFGIADAAHLAFAEQSGANFISEL